jgi:hypothetical protein
MAATLIGMIPHHLSVPLPREVAVKSLWRPFKGSKLNKTIWHKLSPKFSTGRLMRTQQCPYLRLKGLKRVQNKLSKAIIILLRPSKIKLRIWTIKSFMAALRMASRQAPWTPRSTRKAEWAQARRGLIALHKRLGCFYHPIISQRVEEGSSHRTMVVAYQPFTSVHIAKSWILRQKRHRLSSKP